MKDILIGTAGHIDHGKTTLVKALTGIDADRLKEEKQRGITIDIGFAHTRLDEFRVGFIDVPGHERFVKNMLAGVGGIRLVMLVVAADESVMPQTIEHFQICRLLDIRSGLAVITKKSLVEPELLEVVYEEVRELLRDSPLSDAPIVAVDSVSGEGLDALKEALLHQIRRVDPGQLSAAADREAFRLPVDRVFSIRGFGTVVTGTPAAGRLKGGAEVVVLPAGRPAKIRGIEIFNQKSEDAVPGQRAALNLTGVEKDDLERGMVLAFPDTLRPASMLNVSVSLLANAPGPLKHRAPIRFHHGCAEIMGRVYLLENSLLAPGESALAQIRLQQPAIALPRDRFVLRRYSPVATIGGGVILDSRPARLRRRDLVTLLPRLQRLCAVLGQEPAVRDGEFVRYFVEGAGAPGVSLRELTALTGLQGDYLRRLIRADESIVEVSAEPLTVAGRGPLETLKSGIVDFLRRSQERNPLAGGISREEVKKRFLEKAGNDQFQRLLAEMEQEKRVQSNGSRVSVHGTTIALTPGQEQIRDRILELLKTSELQPPTLDELLVQLPVPASQAREVFFFLLKQGELLRITDQLFLLPAHISGLTTRLRQQFAGGRAFGVPEFKDLFGISRKFAIPYLEYLDRRRITRRQGDQRILL